MSNALTIVSTYYGFYSREIESETKKARHVRKSQN